uniref:Uncharacterized protein n=1 Tax=Vitis vinifera TaxID=29760 RepID=F6H5V3_VITVI
MDCTTGLQFVLPESNNESQEDPKIELPNPYFSGSMELMAVPKRKRHKKWTKGSETCSSHNPVQELWPSQATTLLLLQWR